MRELFDVDLKNLRKLCELLDSSARAAHVETHEADTAGSKKTRAGSIPSQMARTAPTSRSSTSRRSCSTSRSTTRTRLGTRTAFAPTSPPTPWSECRRCTTSSPRAKSRDDAFRVVTLFQSGVFVQKRFRDEGLFGVTPRRLDPTRSKW